MRKIFYTLIVTAILTLIGATPAMAQVLPDTVVQDTAISTYRCPWCGIDYTQSGTHKDTLQNIGGEDSIVVEVQLVIKNQITGSADDASHGTVMGSGAYIQGTTAELTANANECYLFVRWNDADTTNPRTITVVQDSTLTAEFEIKQVTVTTESDDEEQGETTAEKTTE